MGGLSDERFRLEGRLRMLQDEAAKIRFRAQGYRHQIRELLDPVAPIEDLDLNPLISELAPELYSTQQKLKSVLRDIHDIQALIR